MPFGIEASIPLQTGMSLLPSTSALHLFMLLHYSEIVRTNIIIFYKQEYNLRVLKLLM